MTRSAAEKFLSRLLDDASLSDDFIARQLTDLTEKGPTTEEILGFLDAMRARMLRVKAKPGVIDVCGTGGDKSGTFNISTAAAIVLAAGGVSVAKHGNRSASSKCGSADVLEALHVPIDLGPEEAGKQLADAGFVFLFAQKYHPSLKRLAIVRKSLGFPTVFNLLGPLLNPAGVKRQVIGTFSLENAIKLCEAATHLSYEHALILTSEDGLDEASLAAPTHLFELRGEQVVETRIKPEDFGLEGASLADLQEREDAAGNAQLITMDLQPAEKLSAHQRVIALNAGLGFYVSGKAGSIASGVELARQTLASGEAAAKLKQLVRSR
jgi:anthranilate phosphoribosyltransferase